MNSRYFCKTIYQRIQVKSVDQDNKKGKHGDNVTLCECVCVCERERERERESDPIFV